MAVNTAAPCIRQWTPQHTRLEIKPCSLLANMVPWKSRLGNLRMFPYV